MSRDWNPILERAREVRTGKSRSYVKDSEEFAVALETLIVEHTSYCIDASSHVALIERFQRLERDHVQAIKALTEVQDRCNELRKENMKLRGVPRVRVSSTDAQGRKIGLYDWEVCPHGTCQRPPNHEGGCSQLDGSVPEDEVPMHLIEE